MRTIRLFFVFSFFVSSVISQAQYTLTSSDVTFLNGEISDYLNTVEKDIIIPDNFGGVTVTSIKAKTYGGVFEKKQLTSVLLPNSLTTIGERAFANNLLTSVAIPNSVSIIEASTFGGNLLKSVVIPNSITSIKDGAFYWNQLTSVVIPNSVTTIQQQAFGNNKLTEVIIPNYVTFIGNSAFSYNQLTSVTIGNSVKEIKGQAFEGNQLTRVTIPNSVTSISSAAFQDNILTEFKLPNNYQGNIHHWTSGPNTFKSGDMVTDLDLDYSIRNQVITVPYTLKISDVVFLNGEITSYINTIEKDIIIPDNFGGAAITTIGVGAFSGSELTSVTIPSSITSIESQAFAGNKLTSIVIPSSVISIGEFAFTNNILTSAIIPNSVTTIKNGTFVGNVLTSINIPHSVTSIGYNAFADNHLTTVIIPNSVTYIGGFAFSYNKLTSIYIPSSLTEIESYVFAFNQITSVTIPNSVISIWNYAFGDNQLTSVAIPNSVTSIDTYAFGGNQLTSISIPNSVTSIGPGAFTMNDLTSVVIPNSVTYIGQSAFTENLLTEFKLPANYQGNIHNWSDGTNTFQSDDLVTDLVNEYTIGNQVGKYTLKISDVTFLNGEITYYSNTIEKDIIIPDNFGGVAITSIGEQACRSTDLTSIVLPNSVKTIQNHAFSDNKLTSVTLGNSVASIGSKAFWGNQLTSVNIPNSVTTIKNGAFGENILKEFNFPNNHEGNIHSWGEIVSNDTSWVDAGSCQRSGDRISTDFILSNYQLGPIVNSTQNVSFCDSAVINGKTYTSSQTVIDTLVGVLSSKAVVFENDTTYTPRGCDSIVTTIIKINKGTSSVQNLFADGSAVISGKVYTSSQTITDSLTSGNGCDSTITTYLTITYSRDSITHNIYDTTTTVLYHTDTIVHSVYDTSTTVLYYTDTTQVVLTDTVIHNVFDTTTVTVTDTNFVTKTNYVNVYDSLIVDLTGIITAINAPFSKPLQVKIYPNPASQLLFLELLDAQVTSVYSYELINVNGSIVANGLLNKNSTSIKITSLSAGTYYVKFYNAQSKMVNQAPIVIRK